MRARRPRSQFALISPLRSPRPSPPPSRLASRPPAPSPCHRIAEIFEEIGIRPQHEPRIAGAQPRLIGLHRAVEREEVGILAEGFGKNAVARGIALAPRLLSLGLGLRHQHRDVAVGLGTDFLALLAALAAGRSRLALPFGLHALVDGLAVLLGQVGPPDPHVDHLDTEVACLAVELVAHARHQCGALVANHVNERRLPQHPPQCCVQQA